MEYHITAFMRMLRLDKAIMLKKIRSVDTNTILDFKISLKLHSLFWILIESMNDELYSISGNCNYALA